MALSGPQRTVATTVGVVVVMASLGFASVPLYDLFCRVTGFGGVTQEADAGSDVILERTIKIRFDASIDAGMPWEFKPVQREMEVRIGETGLAFYEAHNPTDRPIAGTASYNVFPYEAGGYFTKIDCFCFTEQVLQPGETVQMPLTFYVDPEMVDDRDAKHVQTITLGYTFYETELPEQQAQLATDQAKDVN
ncbi:cytochrome c oxidase assembly protein [Pseudooceanicola nitratireducens]|jgi:cytochrome c oxidase assembly protein subunit 11|uniref:Cytochrome c oxidase assembly protein CtaG n=1 Tax=Pseudooceanicola nitratireducens TaxID=517719 RepID=A0A1I1NH00_9RHOB|nr:cytochrome c oxidase assembly protein [Pseudooceanicola nitratireducens]MEC7298697.1 cytochrome c oxidase assembly protein [Pseudomonadota bacterium]MEC7795082.1 cytochrome c oxidase assembly protein [Pseudomonadota bacterium]MEC8669346.1 cytochrome c oxidase assembly protein [Pseudomonadota bacterium]SEI73635.1 cytochrome c oxidase assembly protein subunit 11 [Pseudooceanicola nitratireducens]SFC94023.1 cytochrome c oxidase assembly protein subunit 11 [Pseudooceanicola nitratireducens]